MHLRQAKARSCTRYTLHACIRARSRASLCVERRQAMQQLVLATHPTEMLAGLRGVFTRTLNHMHARRRCLYVFAHAR